MTKIQLLKSELKTLAQEIRSLKSTRKSVPFGFVHGLFSKQNQYRHMHIAYCLLRGKTLQEIENKVNPGNEHSETLVYKYTEMYKELASEAVHTG